MKWKDKKILVTGGGGFLGRYITERLLELNCSKIKTLGRTPQPELEEKGIEVICGDISDSDTVLNACRDCDIVFHVAAKAGIWGSYKEFYSANITGTENVIAGCREHSVSCLINTSTPSVVCSEHDIENGNEAIPYTESFPSYYPQTKAEAEKMVSTASSEDLRTISIRPHLIWGVRDPHIMPRLLDRANKKRIMQIGNGKNLVDMTHVKNAAEAHINAAESVLKNSGISGNNYFVSDDKPVNLWDWTNKFLGDMNAPPITKSISFKKAYTIGTLMEFAFRILPLKGEPPMTRFVAIQLAHSHYFDISAAKQDLGYKPAVDYDDAYNKAIQWMTLEKG